MITGGRPSVNRSAAASWGAANKVEYRVSQLSGRGSTQVLEHGGTGAVGRTQLAAGVVVRRVIAVAVGAVLLSSCSFDSGPSLQPTSPLQGTGVEAPADPRNVWVTNVGVFCLDEPGTATVTGIDLVGAHGLSLDSFGVTPGGGHVLVDPGTMESWELSESKEVSVVCGPPEDVDYVAAVNMQLSLLGETAGEFESAVVHWDTGNRRGSIAVPLEVKINAR